MYLLRNTASPSNQKGNKMLLGAGDILALIIAMSTSIILITLAIRQNAVLHRDNINLRRALRIEKQGRNFYYDPDIAKEDLWTTK